MITRMARPSPAPAQRPIQAPRMSLSPVPWTPALRTKIAATTIAGSLAKPASASRGSSNPVTVSASTMRTATTSLRSRSVTSRTNETRRIAKKASSDQATRLYGSKPRATGPESPTLVRVSDLHLGGAARPERRSTARVGQQHAEGLRRLRARLDLQRDTDGLGHHADREVERARR